MFNTLNVLKMPQGLRIQQVKIQNSFSILNYVQGLSFKISENKSCVFQF